MENYVNSGAAILSKDNIAGTDSLIVSAIESAPKSAVAGIMPVTKAQGPSTFWIEPFYTDKIELLSTTVDIDDNDSQKRISFSSEAADKLRATYTADAFKHVIQNWILWHKHSRQRTQIIDILKSLTPTKIKRLDLNNITDDVVEALKNAIMTAMVALGKRFQLGDMNFSIVGPFEVAFAVLELQTRLPGKLHFMGDDTIDNVYVFPTGTNMSRAGFALFEYADTVQRVVDNKTAEEVYFYYNRSKVILNPIHRKASIVEVLDI